MNFNNPYNYKLRKTNNSNHSQYKYSGPLSRQSTPLYSSNTVNQLAPTSIVNSINNFRLVKITPPNPTPTKANVLPNTSANLFVMQSLESSNKLDDLLKRCREIGKSDKTPAVNVQKHHDQPPKQAKSRAPNNIVKLTNFKLIKAKPKQIPFETKRLLAIRRKNYMQSQLKRVSIIQSKSSSYSLNNKTTKSITSVSLNKKSLVRFKLNSYSGVSNSSASTNTAARIKTLFDQSKRITNNRKNLYKVNNMESSQKILSFKRLKLVNSNTSSIYKTRNINHNLIVKKYRLLTTTKLINRPVSLSLSVKEQALARKNLITTLSLYKLNNSNKQYCLFYNRFGRCSRGESCKLIHDPKRIALCPRFLRGTCNLEKCPFSHAVSAEKTPLCSFYASGCCNRQNCPYSHVYLGKNAEFCFEFTKGFCPLGSKCTKSHLTECPDFKSTKKCPRGKKCPLVHRFKLTVDSKSKKNFKLKTNQLRTKRIDTNNNNESVLNVKEKQEFGASFISFEGDNTLETSKSNLTEEKPAIQEQSQQMPPLKIRPSFGKKT